MKNKRKLIINCMLICILLAGIGYANFYFGGYYLNKDESIQEYLEIKGLENSNCVFEMKKELNSSYALYESMEKNVFDVLEIKHGILGYRTNFVYRGTIEKGEVLSINGGWEKNRGMYLFLRRNNPNVAYVELKMVNNNDEYVFSNWLNEYSWKILEYNDWRKGKYYSYDKDGNLLGVNEF